MEVDEDGNGKLSFDEFAKTVVNTVCDCVLLYFFSVLGGVFGQISLPRHARVHRAVYFPTPYLSTTFT